MSKATQLLRELIALPSVNPAFLPEGHPRAGEQRVAEFLTATAAKAGLTVELQSVPGVGDAKARLNFIGRLTPSGTVTRRILLAPHLDTVNGTDAQFRPVTRRGRIYGRGACDTKGSVAAMFTAVCQLARAGKRPEHTEIIFAGLADEENAQAGSRGLAASGLKADLALVGEPTALQVVSAHKGSLWMKMEARGRSAHGARPDLGVNAVHAMARVVDVLETEYAAQLRRRRHPLLGRPTINVGQFQGGTQPNIVPDLASIVADRRTLPGETEPGVEREILRLLRRHRLKVTFSRCKLAPCPPLETNPNQPLVRDLLRAARQQRSRGVDYFCDAAVLAGGGTPSVVFGPGDIAQAHTADEWISARAVDDAVAVLLRFFAFLP